MLFSKHFLLCASRVPRQDFHAWHWGWGRACRHTAVWHDHWVETWLEVNFCAEYGTANLSFKSASLHPNFKWAYHFRLQRPRPRRKYWKCFHPPVHYHERRPEHLYTVDHFVRARGGRWVWWRDGCQWWRRAKDSDQVCHSLRRSYKEESLYLNKDFDWERVGAIAKRKVWLEK